MHCIQCNALQFVVPNIFTTRAVCVMKACPLGRVELTTGFGCDHGLLGRRIVRSIALSWISHADSMQTAPIKSGR